MRDYLLIAVCMATDSGHAKIGKDTSNSYSRDGKAKVRKAIGLLETLNSFSLCHSWAPFQAARGHSNKENGAFEKHLCGDIVTIGFTAKRAAPSLAFEPSDPDKQLTGDSIRTRRQLPMPSRQNEKAIEGPDYLHCKEAILSCVISLISESRNVQLVVRTSRGMFPS